MLIEFPNICGYLELLDGLNFRFMSTLVSILSILAFLKENLPGLLILKEFRDGMIPVSPP